MNKKGFTLIEMIAVVVIMGILATIATISVSRYREEVRKKELINLRSTISDSYDNYRSDVLMNYGIPETLIRFSSGSNNQDVHTYFEDLAFDGERITLNDLNGSVFALKIKGSLLADSAYYSKGEAQFVKDGTCVILGEDQGTLDEDSSIHEFRKSCVKDENNNIKPSLEEILCLKLIIDGEVKINDFDPNGDSLCRYFGEPSDE